MLLKFFNGRRIRDTKTVTIEGRKMIKIKFETSKGQVSKDIVYATEEEYREGMTTQLVGPAANNFTEPQKG